MSERLGCCLFAHQFADGYEIPHHQPHMGIQKVVAPAVYTCSFLDWQMDPPPPPVGRHMGCFLLEPGDCEKCAFYSPAGEVPLAALLKRRERRRKQRNRRRSTTS